MYMCIKIPYELAVIIYSHLTDKETEAEVIELQWRGSL